MFCINHICTNIMASVDQAGVNVEGPVQIISISDDGKRFTLDKERLHFVLSQVPDELPVAVVSVVGAFRTGKSFLLDLLLRYLRHEDAQVRAGQASEPFRPEHADGKAPWMFEGGHQLEGSEQTGAPDFVDTSRQPDARTGFKWRSGNARCTTGMWLFSRPFIVRRPAPHDGNIAVLLMDTQGMFDNQTSQMLTACIFGLSTLCSSYMIYNVSGRIGEDNLQHVALFSEYARVVVAAQAAGSAGHKKSVSVSSQDSEDDSKRSSLRGIDRAESLRKLDLASSADGTAGTAAKGAATAVNAQPPFQRLEFLVRDSSTIAKLTPDPAQAVEHMTSYLDSVFSQVNLKDLRTVRAQILECFRHISCYMLPHPGEVVAEEPSFTGNIDQIRDKFRVLVERYVHVVFDEQLEPKRSPGGHSVTANELGHYIEQYVKLFQDGAHFPEAQVLLTATAEANNRAAKDGSISHYQKYVRKLTHNGSVYVKHETMVEEERRGRAAALTLFDRRADFGPAKEIARFKAELSETLDKLGAEAIEQNKKRDPMSTMGPYLLALVVMVFFWLLRMLLDTFCWADVCKRASTAASTINSTIFLGLLIVAWQSGAVTLQRINAFMDAAGAGGGLSAGSVMSAVAAAAAVPTATGQPSKQGGEGSSKLLGKANSSSAQVQSEIDAEGDDEGVAGGQATEPELQAGGSGVRRRPRKLE